MFFETKRSKMNKGHVRGASKAYVDGGMSRMKQHYEFRKEQGLDEFLIDDITWHDLSLDEVFARINSMFISLEIKQKHASITKNKF